MIHLALLSVRILPIIAAQPLSILQKSSTLLLLRRVLHSALEWIKFPIFAVFVTIIILSKMLSISNFYIYFLLAFLISYIYILDVMLLSIKIDCEMPHSMMRHSVTRPKINSLAPLTQSRCGSST